MFQNELVNALVVILFFWLASFIVTIAIGLIGKATAKTKTTLDDVLIGAIKLPIRYFAIILGFYFGFKNFDWGWNMGDRIFTINDLMLGLVILTIGFLASRLLKTFLGWYGEQSDIRINQTILIFVRKIISVVVYAVAIMIVFSQLGIEITPLLASLGIAGLAIALGLKSTLENIFAALFLVMDKSISIGDWVQLEDGTKAFIEDISWRTVRIRTIAGNTVIVPNSVFVGEKISSYDYPEKQFSTSILIGVSYDADLEKAEYIAIQAAKKIIHDEKIQVEDNSPIVRYTNLGPSSIDFLIIVKVGSVLDEGRVKHALIKELIKQFRANNIEIPFPQMVIHNKD